MTTVIPRYAPIILFCLISVAGAQELRQDTADMPQRNVRVSPGMLFPQLRDAQLDAVPGAQAQRNVTLDVDQLARYPELLFRVLLQAVAANKGQVVAQLLPHYQQQRQADWRLVQWGQAVVASMQKEYAQSVRLYREIIAREPQNLPVRLQMAVNLFLNHENEAALDQFQRIRAMKLPPGTTRILDQYIDAIHKRHQWSFGGGFSYIRDDNVNAAPRPGTMLYGFRAWEPESASGLQYRLQAQRKMALQDGYYGRVQLQVMGKHYFSNRKYSELTSSIGLSVGKQSGKYDVSIGPFYEKMWYAGGRATGQSLKQYSGKLGVQLEASYWLHPKWQWNTMLQWGRDRLARYHYLQGNTLLWSNTLFYLSGARQFWNVGTDYYRKDAKDSSHAFRLLNLRVGWNQDWPMGLSTYLQANYSRRKYQGYRLFLTERQKNREIGASLSVWHRGVHLAGFTPRLTYSYQTVRSNHAFYRFDKSRAFIELSRRF